MLILLRHGQSVWNAQNRFAGWVDVPLTHKGVEEAFAAAPILAQQKIDVVCVSALSRAIVTLQIALLHHKQYPVFSKLPSPDPCAWCVTPDARWNERHYGALQGRNKDDTAKEFGAEQVQQWRRSFDQAPPGGESLQMTQKRVLAVYKEQVMQPLAEGKNVLIVAHGNTLRALVMHLCALSPEEILAYEIATGVPLFFEKQDGKFTAVARAE